MDSVIVIINGKTYRGKNISVINNKVVIDGKEITSGNETLNIEVSGNVDKINCSGHVVVKGNSGSIDCGGSVIVSGDVHGNIDCGGSCNCRNISGNYRCWWKC